MSHKLSPLILWSRGRSQPMKTRLPSSKLLRKKGAHDALEPTTDGTMESCCESIMHLHNSNLSHASCTELRSLFNSSLLKLFSELFSINILGPGLEHGPSRNLLILNIWLSMHIALDTLNHFNIINDEEFSANRIALWVIEPRRKIQMDSASLSWCGLPGPLHSELIWEGRRYFHLHGLISGRQNFRRTCEQVLWKIRFYIELWWKGEDWTSGDSWIVL